MNKLTILLACTAAMTTAETAYAQRSSENALRAAEDAFGTSVGRESIGLYDPDNVRGFSAVDAGNARLEDLYFDPVTLPSSLLRSSTSIKVGIAAQGFAFPAPTGVVDIRLRRPGDRNRQSLFASVDSYGFTVGEATADLRLSPSLGAAVGAGFYRESYVNGTTDWIASGSVTTEWNPNENLQITPFIAYSAIREAQAPPAYITAGDFLPVQIRRRQFTGPRWAENTRNRFNFGFIGRWAPEQWLIRAGLYRSISNAPVNFINLYLNLELDGRADQLIVAEQLARNGSTSGEFRIDRLVTEGPRAHQLSLTLRGRLRKRVFGGSDFIDLGNVQIGEPLSAQVPAFDFGVRDVDRVRQGTAGVAYGLRWRGTGEFNASLQKTFYRKTTVPGGGTAVTQTASPVLVSAAGTLELTNRLALYASYAEGLEDSGAAPGSATNRNEPLPASLTRQYDLGARWTIKPGLRVIVGAYDLRRPYFQFDSLGAFARLGDTASDGVEIRLSGAITPRLNIVAGAVLGDTKVQGEAVRAGTVGREAVGKPDRTANLALDWQPLFARGLTLSGAVNYASSVVATNSNTVKVAGRTLFDIGARYAFELGGASAQARLTVANITDVYRFDVYGSGVYGLTNGRTAQFSLGIDF